MQLSCFVSLFPAYRFRVLTTLSLFVLFWSHLVGSVSTGIKSQEPHSSFMYVMRIYSITEKIIHLSLIDNPISIFGFCWDDSGNTSIELLRCFLIWLRVTVTYIFNLSKEPLTESFDPFLFLRHYLKVEHPHFRLFF